MNRVFRDKQGGLIVDDLGLADQLKQALATYTESGGQGSPNQASLTSIAIIVIVFILILTSRSGNRQPHLPEAASRQ